MPPRATSRSSTITAVVSPAPEAPMLTRVYLRASTAEQNASRARALVNAFAANHGLTIAATYIENESGTTLARPELFRLLADSRPGDVLLIEQVDRLSRLTADDWQRLRGEVEARQVRIIALDLPTSWGMARGDDFTGRMLAAINGMLLDILAAVARKDYEDRRRRQADGITRARSEGKFRGRPADAKRNAAILAMLDRGMSWSAVQAATSCSRSTIARLAQRRGDRLTASTTQE